MVHSCAGSHRSIRLSIDAPTVPAPTAGRVQLRRSSLQPAPLDCCASTQGSAGGGPAAAAAGGVGGGGSPPSPQPADGGGRGAAVRATHCSATNRSSAAKGDSDHGSHHHGGLHGADPGPLGGTSGAGDSGSRALLLSRSSVGSRGRLSSSLKALKSAGGAAQLQAAGGLFEEFAGLGCGGLAEDDGGVAVMHVGSPAAGSLRRGAGFAARMGM